MSGWSGPGSGDTAATPLGVHSRTAWLDGVNPVAKVEMVIVLAVALSQLARRRDAPVSS